MATTPSTSETRFCRFAENFESTAMNLFYYQNSVKKYDFYFLAAQTLYSATNFEFFQILEDSAKKKHYYFDD